MRRRAKATDDSSDRRVARRALHQVFAFYYEGAQNLASQKKYDQAAKMFEVAVLIASNPSGVYYELAVARAKGGDAKRAISALKSAAASGFADAARLRAEPAFESLHDSAEFAKILESVESAKKPE